VEKFNSDDKSLSSKLVVLGFFPYFRTILCPEHSDGGSLELQSVLPDGNCQQVSGCCCFAKIPSNATIKQEMDGFRQGEAQKGAGERLLYAALK